MYIITSSALVEDITVNEYKTALLVARALFKELAVRIIISELVTKITGEPDLLYVAIYE